MPFEVFDTELRGVKAIKPEALIDTGSIQDNCSKSRANVLRGLYYQKDDTGKAKIVQCFEGVIFNVVVDFKTESLILGESLSTILSVYNKIMSYVPRDFANRSLTLSDTAKVRYKIDNEYKPDREGGIIRDDSTLAIDMPAEDPILSEKDTNWPQFETVVERDLVF